MLGIVVLRSDPLQVYISGDIIPLIIVLGIILELMHFSHEFDLIYLIHSFKLSYCLKWFTKSNCYKKKTNPIKNLCSVLRKRRCNFLSLSTYMEAPIFSVINVIYPSFIINLCSYIFNYKSYQSFFVNHCSYIFNYKCYPSFIINHCSYIFSY